MPHRGVQKQLREVDEVYEATMVASGSPASWFCLSSSEAMMATLTPIDRPSTSLPLTVAMAFCCSSSLSRSTNAKPVVCSRQH